MDSTRWITHLQGFELIKQDNTSFIGKTEQPIICLECVCVCVRVCVHVCACVCINGTLWTIPDEVRKDCITVWNVEGQDGPYEKDK